MRRSLYLIARPTAQWLNLILGLFLWLALSGQAWAERSLTLSWPPNPEPDLAGYIIYYGAASGAYTNALNVGNSSTNILAGLLEGSTYYFEGSTYYFMVTAYNTDGLESAPSDEISVTIPVVVPSTGVPVAGTLSPTVSSSTTAVLNGAVNPNGAQTVAWFEYGLDSSYGWTTSPTNLGSGSSTLWVSSGLMGLLPGQSYHYRLVASNSVGVTNGTDLTFTLPAAAPEAGTEPATSVSSTAAVLNGWVNPNGAATAVWFEFGTNSAFEFSTAEVILPAVNTTLPLSSGIINGLRPGVTYRFRVAANSSAGAAYGPELSFVTPSFAAGASVTLSWPTNPEPDLAGYIVYYGAASGVYTNAINVGNVTNYTVGGLVYGATYYFIVTAYNTSGLESLPSAEVSITIPPAPTAPSASTQPASNVSSSAATFNALVNPNGARTAVYFEYGFDNGYGSTIAAGYLEAGYAAVPVGSIVNSLFPGFDYHYRVVASNSFGVTLGVDMSFSTPAPPLASTQPASEVGSGGATLNAWVNPNGDRTAVYFEYGLDNGYGSTIEAGYLEAGDVAVPVSSIVNSLFPGFDYHYRVVASNSVGVTRGADMSFSTPAPPLASTQPATEVGSGAATLNAWVEPNGATAEVYFEYGSDTTYGLTTAPEYVNSDNMLTAVGSAVDSLFPGTVYHFRVVANNSAGRTFGADAMFGTLALPPQVITEPPDGIGLTEANFNGDVDPNGSNTTAWFEYGLDPNYGSITSLAEVGSAEGEMPYSSLVSGLLPGVTYHYRMAASNSLGRAYGADVSFTTLAIDADVTTLPATAISSTRATLQGAANPQGTGAAAWFQYGLSTNYGNTTTLRSLGNGSNFVAVSVVASNLQADATWHFRLVAINGRGIQYGEDLTFATPGTDLAAVTLPARDIKGTGAKLLASITPVGYSASVYFQYGPTTNFTKATGTITLNPRTTAVSVNKDISGLSPGTPYYYRVVATNHYDVVYGYILSFTTK